MTKKEQIQARYKENPSINRETLAKELDVNVRTVYKAIAATKDANDEEQDLRKPTKSFNAENEVYVIRYGKNKMHSVEATNEQIRKAFMMHKTSIGNLTENQVALEMKWTKREFQAIKHAFDFTKDAAPFTDYDIEKMSSSEMAEYERIEKKRYALLKLETKKHDDIKKEIKRHNQADYFLNRVAELFNEKEVNETHNLNIDILNTDVYSIRLGDVHSGLETDNIFNTYNLEVMRNRFNFVLQWIKLFIPRGAKIILTDGGDTTHGLIHGSVEKHGTYVITATVEVMKCYEELIEELAKYYVVEFAKANGSHEMLEKNNKSRTEEENLGNLIFYTLKRIFSRYDNVTFHEKLKGMTCTVINIAENFDIMLEHGDSMGFKKYSEAAKVLNQHYCYNIKEIWLHHLHHYQAEYVEGVLIERIESFCGTEQYAVKKGLNSPCGFRLTTYNNDGRDYTKFIDLSEVR